MTLTSKGQVLRTVVGESLSAFPEDAHVRLFQFLSNSGASEAEQKELQQELEECKLGKEEVKPILARQKACSTGVAKQEVSVSEHICEGMREVAEDR